MKLILDPWQKEVLETKGNICLRSGRQVGKSTVISIKAAMYALENQNKTVMVIAKVERQAQLLFGKILVNIHDINKFAIKGKKDKPTKHIINLKNGSVIHCLPAGETGYGIMGFTIDLLIADEAAFIPEAVWVSIVPALAITRGSIWLLSTPFIKEGFYFNCFSDPKFTAFHTSSEDCPRKDAEFLEHEKRWMTKAQYAQMYLGQFRDELSRVYSDEIIKTICILEERKIFNPEKRYYLGVDIARMGKDESTFETLDGTSREAIEHVENIMTRKTFLTETEDRILALDRKYIYGRKSIGLDDAGLGAGVHDALLRNTQVKRKIVGLSNAKRSIDAEEGKKKLLKEDMHNNLLRLMQRKHIKLLDDEKVKDSLRSMQFDEETQAIFGRYSHITEGLIRAAWLITNKSLSIYMK